MQLIRENSDYPQFRLRLLYSGFLFAVVLGCFSAEVALAQSPSEGASEAGIIDEILVTARKRNEEVLDVPMSVSVLSGNAIEQLGARNTRDIGSLFPGVSFNDSNGSGGEYSIRGITSAGSGSDTSIGLYVDEVYIGEESAMSQRLFDLQNIQVLRGPQGTVFGRNTVAGAVNIITRKPSEEFGGTFEASVGNYGLRQLGGTLNMPIVEDKFLARVSYTNRSRDGYLDNAINPGDAGNDEDGYNARAHLSGRLTNSLDMLLSFDASNDKTCENMFKIIDGVLFNGNTDPDSSEWDEACESERDIGGVSLRFDKEFENITFTSITAYRDRETTFLTDRDFTGLPILMTGLDQDADQFSQEFRIASREKDGFSWVAGFFYFDRDVFTKTILDLGPGFLGPGNRNTVNALSSIKTESIAVFGTMNYQFSDAMTLEVGLRYTDEDKSLDYEQTATLPIPGFGVVDPFSTDTNDGEWSPTVTLTYKPSDDSSIYGRIARGFKSGGFNAGPSSDPSTIQFKPEFMTNYEFGYKTRFMGGRAQFDSAIFYLDYEDIQQSDQDGAGFFISNAASATSIGVETQFSVQVNDNVNINAGFGYVDAEFDEFGDRSGNKMPRAPEWTGSVSAHVTWDVGAGGTLFFTPTAAYRDDNYINAANTELFKQPSYTIVDLRTGYESAAGWSIAAWWRNLTDERVNLSGFDVAPLFFAVTTSPPLTYGVDFRWNF